MSTQFLYIPPAGLGSITFNVPAGTDPLVTASAATLNFTSTNGSVTITGNSSTNTINFSASGGGTPGGSSSQFQYNNSGAFAGSEYLVNSGGRILVGGANDDTTNSLQVTGGGRIDTNFYTQVIYSSQSPNIPLIELPSAIIFDPNSIESIDWYNRYLQSSSNLTTVEWDSCILNDTGQYLSVSWDGRTLYDTSQGSAIEWGSRDLITSSGQVSVSWDQWQLINPSSNSVSVDWSNLLLLDTSDFVALDWSGRILCDSTSNHSLDWANRYLLDTAGATAMGWTASGIQLPKIVTSYNGNTTVNNGMASVVAGLNLTGQTASISASNLLTPVSGGHYLALIYFVISAAGTSGTITLTLSWNDGIAARTYTTSALTWGTLAAPIQLSLPISTNTTNITYSTTVSARVGSGTYNVAIDLIRTK